MWQNIIIAVIVLACAVYVGRKFFRQARGQAGCGCGSGCGGCTPPGGGTPGQSPDKRTDACGCDERQ